MRKVLAVFLIASFTFASTNPLWSAQPKPGATCVKLGQIATTPGYKFNCIKVKNKLIWDKGTPTVPTPDQYQISPTAINSFADAAKNYKAIKYWAWRKATLAMESNPNPNTPLEILAGPQSKVCSDAGMRAIRSMQRLYGGSQLPKKSTLIYATKEDDDWIKSVLGVDFPESNPPQDAHGVNAKYESYEIHSDSCDSQSAMSTSGASLAHGYTHAVQRLQYIGSKENWGNFPRWLIEGGATFSENFILYGKDYKTWITNPGFHNWDLKQYDEKFYRDFFEYKLQPDGKYTWAHTDQWPNQRAYDVGSYACEVLIAVKGAPSIIELHSEFARTGDFEKSFESIYGLPWRVALPLISKAVYQSTIWLINTPNGLA